MVLAYSISRPSGSEYSVEWNYVREMLQNNKLIVLRGLAGDYMGDVGEVENSELCQKMSNVNFVAVRSDLVMNLLNTFNRSGVLVYTFTWLINHGIRRRTK